MTKSEFCNSCHGYKFLSLKRDWKSPQINQEGWRQPALLVHLVQLGHLSFASVGLFVSVESFMPLESFVSIGSSVSKGSFVGSFVSIGSFVSAGSLYVYWRICVYQIIYVCWIICVGRSLLSAGSLSTRYFVSIGSHAQLGCYWSLGSFVPVW